MRGRTFNDAICIFDEAQNASYQQLKLFLSRFGQNTQVIVTGDPFQSDLPYSPAPLVQVVEKLRGVDGIHTVKFSNDDVVRHPLVSAILKKL
jgi:phosphate starvation-inducible PhoH-like protein